MRDYDRQPIMHVHYTKCSIVDKIFYVAVGVGIACLASGGCDQLAAKYKQSGLAKKVQEVKEVFQK